MKLFIGLIVSLLYYVDVESFPFGPPVTACESMVPNHQGTQAQPMDTSPYKIMVDATKYGAGYRLNVTIVGEGDETFKGFFIQARKTEGGTDAIGSFMDDNVLDTRVKTVFCSRSSLMSGISHGNADEKHSISVMWMAPDAMMMMGDLNDIFFRATVVREYSTYWVGLQSESIMYDEDAPPLPPVMASSNTIYGNVILAFILSGLVAVMNA